MEAVTCPACGAVFSGKFCPECGLPYGCVPPKKPEPEPAFEEARWWRGKSLVGTYRSTEETKNLTGFGCNEPNAELVITDEGAVRLTVQEKRGPGVYFGVLSPERTNGSLVFRREDGRPFGSGHACQPACSGSVYPESSNRIVVRSDSMPPPICYGGFCFHLDRVEE